MAKRFNMLTSFFAIYFRALFHPVDGPTNRSTKLISYVFFVPLSSTSILRPFLPLPHAFLLGPSYVLLLPFRGTVAHQAKS